MTQHSHQTTPTQFVDAAGVRFAHSRDQTSAARCLVTVGQLRCDLRDVLALVAGAVELVGARLT